MDSRDFLEKKGIEPTTIVAYHYTGDPEDGINIDIELLMNEFRDEILKEREHESLDENAALTLHDVSGSASLKKCNDCGIIDKSVKNRPNGYGLQCYECYKIDKDHDNGNW